MKEECMRADRFFIIILLLLTGTFPAIAQRHAEPAIPAGESKTPGPLKFIENIVLEPDRPATDAQVVLQAYPRRLQAWAIHFPDEQDIEKCTALQFKYAMLTERDVESVVNAPLYSFIEAWWGTPYRYGGGDSSGIDCSSFCNRLLGEVYRVNLPRTAREQYNAVDKIAAADLVEGDLVFFNTRGGISHVGVYLGNNYFVHSSVHDGVTINSLLEPYYNDRFKGGGRITMQAATGGTLP